MRLLPQFKGYDFFPHDLRLPFMRYKGLCFILSIVGMLLSLALFAALGLNYGVDFKGGSMLEVQSKSGPADIAGLRDKLGKLGVGAVQIQSFGAPSDVLIRVGIFSLLQLEFDLSIVAALLTILGYSVNDTVVVSDRIRENLRKYKRMELNELLNLSINETLSRTILTGCTAIVVLVAL